jgi:hypothetical protein
MLIGWLFKVMETGVLSNRFVQHQDSQLGCLFPSLINLQHGF